MGMEMAGRSDWGVMGGGLEVGAMGWGRHVGGIRSYHSFTYGSYTKCGFEQITSTVRGVEWKTF